MVGINISIKFGTLCTIRKEHRAAWDKIPGAVVSGGVMASQGVVMSSGVEVVESGGQLVIVVVLESMPHVVKLGLTITSCN